MVTMFVTCETFSGKKWLNITQKTLKMKKTQDVDT